MIYKHEAIYKLNPSVVAIRDDIAYDVEGNVVSYNNSAATTEGNITELRTERNAKLAETDWEIVIHKEKGTNIPTALKTYRQSLRDITDTYTSLDDVVWPEKP